MLSVVILLLHFCYNSTNEEVIMRMREYLGGASDKGCGISMVALHTVYTAFVLQRNENTESYQIQ